ncbi:MAG: hypothetical protein HKN82_18615 [Akkermansiaceae bacterium]|nr:hypothetical protein [Akkermansiaceae bacterium]NNM30294.1 hypothetical protein [Akkermansiaceae bacterium]
MKGKAQSAVRGAGHRGMALVELAVMIGILMSLVSLLFVGVRAWKHGVDRADCVSNIRNVQLAVRGYANTNDLEPGADLAAASPPVDLGAELFGVAGMMDRRPDCPGEGVYTLGGDIVPPLGTLYMTCSESEGRGHFPADAADW